MKSQPVVPGHKSLAPQAARTTQRGASYPVKPWADKPATTTSTALRLIRNVLPLAAVIGSQACAGPSDCHSYIAARFAAEADSSPVLNAKDLLEIADARIVQWDELLPTLRALNPELGFEVEDNRLSIRSPDQQLDLVFPVTLAGGDSLDFVTWGMGRRSATLRIAAPEGSDSSEISLDAEPGQHQDGGQRAYRFELPAQSEPDEAPRRAVFSIRLPPSRLARVDRLELGRQVLRVGAMPGLTEKEHLIAHAGSFRSGLVTSDGASICRRVELPPQASVTGEVVTLWKATTNQRIAARIAIRSPEGTRTHEVDTSTPDWSTFRFELSNQEETNATICLESDSNEPHAVAWGNPEVVGRAPTVKPPDILLISIDTLRPDRLSLYGNSRQTSPNIDEWARRNGVVFANAIASAPWTLPSHASLLTGLEAWRHGVNFSEPAPPGLVFLAETLRRQGYRTVAVVGGGYLHPHFGLLQGFDVVESHSSEMGLEAELENSVRKASEWLDAHEGDGPFFLFFHTYSVHNPYRRREPYFSRLTHWEVPEETLVNSVNDGVDAFLVPNRSLSVHPPSAVSPDPSTVARLALDLYDSSIAYTDSLLAQVLKRFNTTSDVVVLTSDHGELFGEHGYYNHFSLFAENINVPLVVGGPNLPRGIRSRATGRGVDVLPTILDLAGLPGVENSDGISLIRAAVDGPAWGPKEAWTYAPSSGFGIARLDLVLDTKYLFDDTARERPWPRERTLDLSDAPASQTPTATAVVRRATAKALASAPYRLRLELKSGPEPIRDICWENLGEDPLRSKILTPGVEVTVRNTNSWTCVDLEPGQTAHFGLGMVAKALRLGSPGRVVNVEIGPRLLPRTINLTLSGPTLVPAASAQPPYARVSLAPDPTRPSETPPAMHEVLGQLRALGYIQ